jgi:hypothetical protein
MLAQGHQGRQLVMQSPKLDEPWSRSPVVNAAKIRILFLAGMVPLPRLDAYIQDLPATLRQ